jgi:hypothetical protein
MNASEMTAKERLLAHIESHDGPAGFSEEAFAELGRLVEALKPLSPIPQPMDAEDRVEGRWETLFAHFGARHSAGKPKVHDSTLKVHSFNAFPASPVRIERICQEIARQGRAYNNVTDFSTPSGVRGSIVVRGRYRDDESNRQRFVVEFHRVELQAAADVDELQLRTALGLEADQALALDLPPPRMHSDVIYLDEQIRINVGSFGGLYVLIRSADPPVSIPA